MPRDGLQFAAELLRSLTPAIILVLELVWLVRWALAKLLVRLQDRAYSAVATGYLEPSAAPSTANEVRFEDAFYAADPVLPSAALRRLRRSLLTPYRTSMR